MSDTTAPHRIDLSPADLGPRARAWAHLPGWSGGGSSTPLDEAEAMALSETIGLFAKRGTSKG